MKEQKEKEKNSNYYDRVYSTSKVYIKNPEEIDEYFSLWTTAADIISKSEYDSIIDLGCGPGHFAKVILDKNILGRSVSKYFGYDFSSTSLSMAKNLIKNNNLCIFEEKNLLEYDFSYLKSEKSIYVSFEFLEHIYEDLSIIRKIPVGSDICFSVPSFDAIGHVRYFNTSNDVINRYSELININNLIEINFHNGKNKVFLFEGIRI